MQSFNQIILIGRVGNAPEFTVHGEKKKATFRLATTNMWKDKSTGEIKEKTNWHNITCFGSSADYARKYVSKGAECFVKGQQENTVFEKDNGDKSFSSQVLAKRITANKYVKSDNTGGNLEPEYFPEPAAAQE